MNERERVARLASVLGAAAPGVLVGIGDDAAVLDAGGGRLVWTIDEQVEGTHFRRELLGWADVGWRSTMAAASDVAAMAATPWCALAALALPADFDDAALDLLARGQREAADRLGAPIVGGNLSRGAVVSVTTTVLGRCARAVERAGGRAGDGLWLAGRVGLAGAGFQALERRSPDPRVLRAVAAWQRPTALVAEGLSMGGVARAAVDVSDGLARDVGHLADASGLQGVLDEVALLADVELLEAALALGLDPLALALHGGEDYALVAASEREIPGFRRIGELRQGAGIVLRTANGERAIDPGGFDHFTSPSTPPGACCS